MSIRYIPQINRTKQPDIKRAINELYDINTLRHELIALKNSFDLKLSETHSEMEKKIKEGERLIVELKKAHDKKLAQTEADLNKTISSLRSIIEDTKKKNAEAVLVAKGDPGEPGDDGIDAPPVDEKALELKLSAKIPKTEDIVKKVLSKIPVPKEIEPDSIAEIVNTHLDKGKIKLGTKHIEGWQDPEVILARFHARGGLKGGGDTVTAGSNITITTDSSGRKVITSSGGSGFTELSATETPDGSTTVFTFPAASAQPSYLVVDNVWLKATSKAGTTNWTWASGPKQATLTIPANDDIYGIV